MGEGGAGSPGIAFWQMKLTQKHSKPGDLVLVPIADELHFGVVAYANRLCPWTNVLRKDGVVIAAEVPTILHPKRIYFFEPFEE